MSFRFRPIICAFAALLICSVAISSLAMEARAQASSDDAARLLEWAIYNQQDMPGAEKDKVMYVFGALGCGWTQKFINSVAWNPNVKAQIRWVFPNSRENSFYVPGTGYAMTENLPEAFNEVGKDIRKTETDRENLIAGHNMNVMMLLTGEMSFPSIWYEGLNGLRKAPEGLLKFDEIVPMKHDDKRTRAIELIDEMLSRGPGKPVKVENRTKEVMHSYALPDENSPSMDKFMALKPMTVSNQRCWDYSADFYMCETNQGTNFFYKKNGGAKK